MFGRNTYIYRALRLSSTCYTGATFEPKGLKKTKQMSYVNGSAGVQLRLGLVQLQEVARLLQVARLAETQRQRGDGRDGVLALAGAAALAAVRLLLGRLGLAVAAAAARGGRGRDGGGQVAGLERGHKRWRV